MTRKRNPIEDPLQYPVQGRVVVRSGKTARSVPDVVLAKDDDKTTRRSSTSKIGDYPSQHTLDDQARRYEAMAPEERARRREHAALLARIAERSRLANEEDDAIARASSRTDEVRAFFVLRAAARGEAAVPGVLPEDSATVAHEALVSDTADLFLALNHAIRANQARRVLEQYAVHLEPIFRRAKGGEKVGVTEKQARAWVLNEVLDKGESTGSVHKQEGGRILGIDPTSFQELVEKAHRKLQPGGALEEVRAILAEAARVRASIVKLSEQEYDVVVGPSNRKGGRSIELRSGLDIPERDTSKTTRGGVRTPAPQVRYSPRDRVRDD